MAIRTCHCSWPCFDARRVRLRIGQLRHVDVLGLFDLLFCPVIDEDRFAAPEHLDHLALPRSARDRPRSARRPRWWRRRDSSAQPGASARGGADRRDGSLLRCRENLAESARPKTWSSRSVLSYPSVRPQPACASRGAAPCARRGGAAWRRRANSAARPSLQARAQAAHPAAFYWHPCQGSASGAVPQTARKSAHATKPLLVGFILANCPR